MRISGQRLAELYGTQLGQDVVETLVGAGIAAGGQALFTDMTPEQIALSTVLGVGAAAVGRPIVGRTGQIIGNQLSKNPAINRGAQQGLNFFEKGAEFYGDAGKAAWAAKMRPYAHLPAAAQLGQFLGRGYGDNLAQAVVALAAPQLVQSLEPADGIR